MSGHTTGRLRAVICRHAGQPDTICLKDEQGNELVNWMGFDGNVHTKSETRANAKRLAAGWNALDEANETILSLRASLAGIIYHFSDSEQAPGHSHEVPGIWDSDNPPSIAGKPCAWCAHWNAAIAALSKESTP